MKYVIVKGARDHGKSTTIDAVCSILNPERIQRVNTDKRQLEYFDRNEPMHNGCFLLRVHGKIILISAGATTEHKTRITVLIDILIELNIQTDFAIVAMRRCERMEGFNTPEELTLLGEDLGLVESNLIDGDYQNSSEWKDRVQRIVDMLRKAGLEIESKAVAG